MKQAEMLQFTCAAGLVKNRFVTITKAIDTVAYTAVGLEADGVTIGDESNLKIAVQLLSDTSKSFFFDALGTFAVGDAIQVSTDGTGIIKGAGATVCYAKTAGVSGSLAVGYNVNGIAVDTINTAGTVAAGSTVAEEGIGDLHKTTLTVSTTLGAIAGGANLALGKLVYTFPAGIIFVKSAYMTMALNESDGNITADTPDVGIGTTLANGVVNVLGGTAAFENIITGQTAADCNATATVKTIVNQPLAIETAGDHTVYFNVADGWAASGEAACAIAGTIVLEWELLS